MYHKSKAQYHKCKRSFSLVQYSEKENNCLKHILLTRKENNTINHDETQRNFGKKFAEPSNYIY